MSTWAEWIVDSTLYESQSNQLHWENVNKMCQAGRIQFKCNMHDTLRTIILCFPNLVQVVVPWTELGESLEPVRKFYFRQACIRSNVDQVADEMVWKQDLTMRYCRGGNWDIMVVGGTGMTTRMWRLRNSNFRCEFHSQTELWINMILIRSRYCKKIVSL